MALRLFDGFDGADAVRKGWTISDPSNSLAVAGGPYGVGYAWRITNNNHWIARSFVGYNKAIVGYTVAPPASLGTAVNTGVTVGNGTNNLRVAWTAAFTMTLYRDTTVLATATVPYPGAVYQRHEIEATFHASTGTVKFWINGTLIFNFTGQTTTGPTTFTSLVMNGQSTASFTYYDDVVVCDDVDGTTLTPPQKEAFNTPLGDVRVNTYFPSGAGSSTAWTPSTGANWTTVDEVPVNDADFVTSGTSAARDLYAFPDRSGLGTILAVQTNTHANKDDAGARSIRHVVKSASAVELSSDIALGATLLDYAAMFHKDPNTAAAWTEAGFNAAEFGFEVV